MQVVDFLRSVPVLAGLSNVLLERLAGEVANVQVEAGQWIMREGEAADSMFIVRSGRVEVVDEGPPERTIRILRRGDALGELALLREGKRSASVRARRDARLFELGRAQFEALIQDAPSFALGLTRAMGAQLAASRTPMLAATTPRTIAVVGLEPAAPTAGVAHQLADAFSLHGTTALLSDGELATIDQAERDVERVVMSAAVLGDAWGDLCVAEADLIVVLSTGDRRARWHDRAASLEGCELLVFGPAPAPGVLEALRPREVQVIAQEARRRSALEATARRLAGCSVGVVFSGGGARAFAHLGVLEELTAAGLSFDRVAGVSFGSLVGAATAAGFTPEGTYETCQRCLVDANPANDFALPVYSLIRGAKTRRRLQEVFGERRIEELPRRFFSLSCDLLARETVLHNSGLVVDAVYPSLLLPGVFPPVATPNGRLLVDGGVLDNLPVAAMARTGEGPVIAIDVTGRKRRSHGERPRPPRRPRLEPLARPFRRALTGSEIEIPHLSETIARTVAVGSSDTVAAARLHADLVITPQVEGIALMDWKALPRAAQLGREAARRALAANPDFPGSLRGSEIAGKQ